MQKKAHRILIIGDLLMDIYYKGEVNRISPEAPVPVLKKKGNERFVPGGASNVAVNIVASGCAVCIAGVVGKDKHGDELLKLLCDQGVDVSMVQRTDIETISKIRFISDNNQQLLRMDIEDVDDIKRHIDYDELLSEITESITEYQIIVLSDYMKGVLTADFTQRIIGLAQRHQIPVLIDVKDPHYQKYRGAWLLKPNRKELSVMTNMPVRNNDEIIDAGRFLLRETSSEFIITTCGADGMILIGKDAVHHLDSVGKEVYDVTGAGDTVIAYLASQLASGQDIITAMEIANYAAGIQVGKAGTSAVYIQEVREIMDGLGSTYLRKKIRWRELNEFTRKIADKKVVFTNGCFDILHVGHKRYLEEARKLGDLLIVGVNSDASVRRLKGPERPINSERDRVELLTALDCVDYVIVFEDDTPQTLIERIKPDVLVKGGDYRPEEVVGKETVEAKGGKVVIIPLVKGKSTTALIQKIR